eukprot:TRINITY_DN29288_c0_g1_i1.p1 TRINITY_DN29288_c0_g1~~TRINITY_DN29288_c0_g1_i1.p1  ORF type:complete len:689 (-),score=225.92 TRINITY_DN29288_c0_g1_i1:63-2129(-)
MEDPEIPETGAVFTFGKSKFAENAPSKFWIKKDEVTLISCGDEHTAVVTETGRLFTFGSNEWGQLGLGHNNNVIKPSCVKTLKPDLVAAVACGRHHTIVAMQSGVMFAMGSNSEGQLGVGRNPEWTSVPMEFGGIEGKIAKVSAGTTHSLALTDRGQVWVWGSNTEGQLGLGEEGEENVFQPVLLPFNNKVMDINCGYYHSAIVTDQGELFTFGEVDGGKLGLNGVKDETDSPRLVNIPEPVTSVSCGGNHTIVLTQAGKLYSFGQSTNGQLGLGNRILESSTPHPLVTLAHVQIVSVSCGENHSVALSASGQLYTFGDGRHGKLCLDLETITNHFSPAYVARFRGFKVTKAVAGGCHTMVLAVPIQDYDENMDNQEEEIFKINGAIHEEINTEARERRRSGLKEEQKLPPIRARPALEEEEIKRVKGVKEEEQEEEEDQTNSENDLSSSIPPETDNSEATEKEQNEDNPEEEVKEEKKEEKKEGKLSKFFSGFRKKKTEDVSDSQEAPEVEQTDQSRTSLENKNINEKSTSNELINEELDNADNDTPQDEKELEETPSPDKTKKKVSFFRQFSKESKEDKTNGSQESIGSGMKGLQKAMNKKPPPVPEGEEKSENSHENGEDGEDGKDAENDSFDDETDSELEDSYSSPVKASKVSENKENTSTPVPVDVIQSKATTKIKSKSCSIL